MRMDVLILEGEKFDCSVCKWMNERIEIEVMPDVAYAPIFQQCFWKWDIFLYDIIIVIRYRLHVISPQSRLTLIIVLHLLKLLPLSLQLHSIMLNISLFSYTFRCYFSSYFLFIISLTLSLLHLHRLLNLMLLLAEQGREKKEKLIGFLRRGCFIASGLNVNVIIIMIIRNVSFVFAVVCMHNNWMEGICQPVQHSLPSLNASYKL